MDVKGGYYGKSTLNGGGGFSMAVLGMINDGNGEGEVSLFRSADW